MTLMSLPVKRLLEGGAFSQKSSFNIQLSAVVRGDLLRWNSGIPTPKGEDLPGEWPTKVEAGSDV